MVSLSSIAWIEFTTDSNNGKRAFSCGKEVLRKRPSKFVVKLIGISHIKSKINYFGFNLKNAIVQEKTSKVGTIFKLYRVCLVLI
jgi:hypothetical protein